MTNYIIQKLLAYDPTLDTSVGSPLRSLVIDPIAETLLGDTLDTDARSLMLRKLKEAYPDLTLGSGDAVVDIIVNAGSLFMEPYRAELSRISRSQSLLDPASLSDDDVDALASNWVVTRIIGAFARVNVLVTFSALRTVTISQDIRFLTSNGLAFRPVGQYTIPTVELRTFATGDNYTVPIQCIAEDRGVEYNVAAGAIVASQNISNVVSVTNTAPALGGIDAEDGASFVDRLSQVINERSLVSDRGIRAKVLSDRSDIEHVTVVGFGDVEMERDAVSASLHGDIKGSGFAVVFNTFAFIGLYAGDVAIGDTLHIKKLSNDDTKEVIVSEVYLGPIPGGLVSRCTAFVVGGDFADNAGALWSVTVEEKQSAEFGSDTITSDVHLGGKADVYLLPVNDEQGVKVLDTPIHIGGFVGDVLTEFSTEGLRSSITLGTMNAAGQEESNTALVAGKKWLIIHDGDLKGAHKILGLRTVQGVEYLLWDRLSQLGQGIPSKVHRVRWSCVDTCEIAISKNTATLLPKGGEHLSVTLLASRSSVITTRDDLYVYVKAGDFLEIPSLSIFTEIASINGDILTVVEAPLVTGVFDDARIVRRVERVLSPIVEPVSLTLGEQPVNYGPCIGSEVLTATRPSTVSSGERGRVLPHYRDMFLVDDRRFSLDVNNAGYRVLNYGQNDPDFDTFTSQAFSGAQGVSALRLSWLDTDKTFEVEVPNDLFLPGPYTLVSCYGDIDPEALLEGIAQARVQGAAIDTIANLVPSRMPQPANGSSGDVLNISGKEYVIDAVYPISIPLETFTLEVNDTERVFPRERVLRITLLRLRTHADPPTMSNLESHMRFNHTHPSGEVMIDLYDFVSMLCSPSKLLPANISAQLNASVNGAVAAEGLPAGLAVNYTVSDLDEAVCDVVRPSTGDLALYYTDERTLKLASLAWPKFTHEFTTSAINTGVLDFEQAAYTRADELYLNSPELSSLSPSTWSRLSKARAVGVTLNESLHVLGPNTLTEADVLTVDIGESLQESIQLSVDSHLLALKESLMTESDPPSVEAWSLYLKESVNGTSPQDWIQNDSFKQALSTDGGATLIGDVDLTWLLNARASKVVDVLNALDPNDNYVIDFGVTPRAAFTFYYCVPSSERYGLPIFSTEAGSRTLTLERSYESQEVFVPLGLRGDYLWIDSSPIASDEATTVVSTSSESITINKTMPRTTDDIDSRGWVYTYTDSDDYSASQVILEGGFVDYVDENGVITSTPPIIGDNFCGVGTGGTTRFFNSLDVGKTISFVNNVWSPDRYDPIPGLMPEPPGFPEDPYIEKAHVGVYTITDVSNLSEVDAYLGTPSVYAQVVTLDRDIDLTDLPQYSAIAEASSTPIPLFFHLANNAIPAESGDYKTCITGQIYHNTPSRYRISALDSDFISTGEQKIYLTTDDDLIPSRVPFGVFERAAVFARIYNAQGSTRIPFFIDNGSEISVTTSPYVGGIHRAVTMYTSSSTAEVAVGSARNVDNAGEAEGYYLKELGEAYSEDEDTYLCVPPRVSSSDILNDAISFTYLTSIAVRALAGQYIAPKHRVVCSDTLFRRILPCHLGVYMRYDGGSDSAIVASDIRHIVSQALSSGNEISASDIIAIAHKRGSTRVTPGTFIYYTLSDLDRRVHVSFIKDTFDNSQLGEYRGTRRTTGIRVPVASRLGVTLDIERN